MVIRHDKSANLQQYICLTLHEVHFILLTLVPRNCTYPFGADRQISFYCPLLVTAGGGKKRAMESRLCILATCGFGLRISLEAHNRLPSFGGYSLENLKPFTFLLSQPNNQVDN